MRLLSAGQGRMVHGRFEKENEGSGMQESKAGVLSEQARKPRIEKAGLRSESFRFL
jgi:hypothetical protein